MIESEKPMSLDEEIDNYFKHWTEDEYTGAACHYQYANLNDCRGIARHFAQWGAEHTMKQMMKDAIDTTVHLEPGANPVIEIGVSKFGLKVKDKVRVIIIKED